MVTGAACESAVSERASAGWDRHGWELRRRAEMRSAQMDRPAMVLGLLQWPCSVGN